MPRQNPARTLQSEDNLARRIAYERARHEWSYETLAQAMTEAGCPIQGSALYKIEKGTPRRRVTVDELVALAAILDVPAQNLLMPIDLIGDGEAEQLVSQWLDLQVKIGDLVAQANTTHDRLDDLRRSGTLRAFPIHHVLGSGLFRTIRKAQAKAADAFELFRHEWQHHDGSADPGSAALISRARARAGSGVDDHGRSHPKEAPR